MTLVAHGLPDMRSFFLVIYGWLFLLVLLGSASMTVSLLLLRRSPELRSPATVRRASCFTMAVVWFFLTTAFISGANVILLAAAIVLGVLGFAAFARNRTPR